MSRQLNPAAALILVLGACGPRMQAPRPVSANGAVIPSTSDEVVHRARVEAEEERARMAARGEIMAPTAPCETPACSAAELLRQGDEYTTAGRLDMALERYDQADILRPNHAETNLRIATVLDKSLRPVEAIMRYQMFIHQMELEKIRAEGEVAASIAEAIARAHERIIVLERR